MATPTKFTYDVFLSHNSKDKVRVRRLAERLRGAGLRVWFDDWVIRPGDDIYLTIERGLGAARTLVLCLSPAAVESEWVGLERSTVLFRDPSNADRRFIPLLLADCDLPDTIRRYKYVDFREEAEAAFEELLSACRPAEEPRHRSRSPSSGETAKPAKKPKQDDSLAVLERKLTGHTDWVNSVAVSPDGKWVASGSDDKTVKIWDIETGNCQATLEGHADRCELRRDYSGWKEAAVLLGRSHDPNLGIPLGSPRARSGGPSGTACRSVVPIAKGELLLSGGSGERQFDQAMGHRLGGVHEDNPGWSAQSWRRLSVRTEHAFSSVVATAKWRCGISTPGNAWRP